METFYCDIKLTVIVVIPKSFNEISGVIALLTSWASHHHQFSNWRFTIESIITRAVSWNISWIKKEWDQLKLLAIIHVWLMIKVTIAVNEHKQCIHSRNRLDLIYFWYTVSYSYNIITVIDLIDYINQYYGTSMMNMVIYKSIIYIRIILCVIYIYDCNHYTIM